MAFRSQDLKYLVDEHGKSLTFTVKGDPIYDTSTGTIIGGLDYALAEDDTIILLEDGGRLLLDQQSLPPRSETAYTVKGYFYNYTLSDIDGSDIQRGDRRLVINLVDTSGDAIPEPESGDEVSGEGDKVSIVRVSKIMSGSSAVCYMCQVRE